MWDPLPFWEFLEGLRDAVQLSRGSSFLDVGCGIGTKLALAHHLGFAVAGIERHAPYAAAARDLVPEATVICADAFDVDELPPSDLVYMYRPMINDCDEERLEEHIRALLAPGTVLWLPHRGGIKVI